MRAFVAIDLPDDVRAALERLQDRVPCGRVLDPETLHLTLAFLGEQREQVLEDLHPELEAISAEVFTLQPRGLGTFGKGGPKLLWAGLEPEPALDALHDKVRRAARSVGIDLPRERFRPHVTLARFGDHLTGQELEKLRGFLERFEQFTCPPFEVTGFTLFQSRLLRDGAVHDPLAEYPFQP